MDQVERKGRSFRRALGGNNPKTDAPVRAQNEGGNQRLGLYRSTLDPLRAEDQSLAGTLLMLAHWPARRKDRLGFGSLRAVETHAYPASYALPQKFAAG